MDEDLLTEALLDAVTVGAKLHGMPVDTATLAGQFHPDGAPIHDELVPAFAEARRSGRVDEEAKVSVLSGLTKEQCVCSPPPFDLVGRTRGDQSVDDLYHLAGGLRHPMAMGAILRTYGPKSRDRISTSAPGAALA